MQAYADYSTNAVLMSHVPLARRREVLRAAYVAYLGELTADYPDLMVGGLWPDFHHPRPRPPARTALFTLRVRGRIETRKRAAVICYLC